MSDHPPQQCLQCGYSLQGLPSPRCPECGFVNDDDPAIRELVRRTHRNALTVMFGMGGVIHMLAFLTWKDGAPVVAHMVCGPLLAAGFIGIVLNFLIYLGYLVILRYSARPFRLAAILVLIHLTATFIIPLLLGRGAGARIWMEIQDLRNLFDLELLLLLFLSILMGITMPAILLISAGKLQHYKTVKLGKPDS